MKGLTSRLFVSVVATVLILVAIAIMFPVGGKMDRYLIYIALGTFIGSFWLLGGLSR